MRKPRPVNVYKDKEYIKSFSTIFEASNYTNETTPVIRYSLEYKRPTRRGYFYSDIDDKLTKEELEEVFKEVRRIKKKTNKPTKDDEEQEISFHFHRSKEKKKEQLKQFIYTKLRKEWLTSNPIQGKLERKFINSILEAI